MTREKFGQSMRILDQMELGYYGVDGCRTAYRDGFFMGYSYWQMGAYGRLPPDDWASFDTQKGFRRAVNNYQDQSGENDAWDRGFEDAIVLFREAKGL